MAFPLLSFLFTPPTSVGRGEEKALWEDFLHSELPWVHCAPK